MKLCGCVYAVDVAVRVNPSVYVGVYMQMNECEHMSTHAGVTVDFFCV